MCSSRKYDNEKKSKYEFIEFYVWYQFSPETQKHRSWVDALENHEILWRSLLELNFLKTVFNIQEQEIDHAKL